MRRAFVVLFIVCCAALSTAQTQPVSEVKQFARVDSPVTALEHVRVIDVSHRVTIARIDVNLEVFHRRLVACVTIATKVNAGRA